MHLCLKTLFATFFVVLTTGFLLCTMNLAGSGSDVGNPIGGTVAFSDNSPAAGTMIYLGSRDSATVLDSVVSGADGSFLFERRAAGEYVVSAQQQGEAGVVMVNNRSPQASALSMRLLEPFSVVLSPITSDSVALAFAVVSGTPFIFTADSGGLYLELAPVGDTLIIWLTDENGIRYRYTLLNPSEGCHATITVDPRLKPEQWQVEGCGIRDPLAAPKIIWCTPTPRSSGALARVNYTAAYDAAIQFSHPMNTRLTENALCAFSSDNSTSLLASGIRWKGSDMVYLTLTIRRNVSVAGKYTPGVHYGIVIGAGAQSGFGVEIAEPETLMFMPEPLPRITRVYAFRHEVAASFELVDSLPPQIFIDDQVSPAIAAAESNRILMSTTYTPDTATLSAGISCFENNTAIVCSTRLIGFQKIEVIIPGTLRCSKQYRVAIDTTLLFGNMHTGRPQSIVWSTRPFTIDTAILLGQGKTGATIPLSTMGWMGSDQTILPNQPYITFYASTNLDSSSVRNSIEAPVWFPRDSLIIETNRFGWRPQQWLPSAQELTFSIKAGLRSVAGDTLDTTYSYTVYTDSLRLAECSVFGYRLRPPGRFDTLMVPKTIVPVPAGTFFYNYQGNWDYSLKAYSSSIYFNAPVDSAALVRGFKISPALGMNAYHYRTGMLFSFPSLVPETTYTFTLDPGIADTFGTNSRENFSCGFTTEKFSIKLGNMFGYYIGFPDSGLREFVPQLPQQPLPPVIQVVSGVQYPVMHVSLDSVRIVYNESAVKNSSGYRNIWPAYLNPNPDVAFAGNQNGIIREYLLPGFDPNRNFLAFSGVPDSTCLASQVTIIPDDNTFRLKVDGNKLRFSTTTYAQPSTQYRITVHPGFRDIYGRTLNDSFATSLNTAPFRVSYAWVGSKCLLMDSLRAGRRFDSIPTAIASIGFRATYPIAGDGLTQQITMNPPIKGAITLMVDSVAITPRHLLIPDTLYTMHISRSIKEVHGVELDSAYTITLRTRPFAMGPLRIGTLEGRELFGFGTNSRLDYASCVGAVHISPARYASGTFQPVNDSTGVAFVPDSSFRLGDEISVAVDTTLTDYYGKQLKAGNVLTWVITSVGFGKKRR